MVGGKHEVVHDVLRVSAFSHGFVCEVGGEYVSSVVGVVAAGVAMFPDGGHGASLEDFVSGWCRHAWWASHRRQWVQRSVWGVRE